MNAKFTTTCLFIASLLAPVAAFAADGDTDRAHPMIFVKDSVITTKVKTLLAAEKMASLAHIKVDTNSTGEVYLSGTVKTQDEADKAVAIARSVKGVASVTSDLKIKKDE